MTRHPAKRPRPDSHSRGLYAFAALGGSVVFCAVILVWAAKQCTSTQSTVKETDSLGWWFLHSVETGWHRMECADYTKMSHEALTTSRNAAGKVAGYLKQYQPRMPKVVVP